MEMHCLDTDFPYTVTESFLDFFDGINHVPVNYAQAQLMHNQESLCWSTNMNSYRYELSGPGSTSYYDHFEVNDHVPTMDIGRREWENISALNIEEPVADTQYLGNAVVDVQAIPEQGISNQQDDDNSSQVMWEDNIDLDNMTYEELLDLGAAVGTHSRGLSKELISLLPTTKYKCRSFFSRNKSGERCVICQMKYKRGNRQMRLPCEHIYHSECIIKWLSINKICPVCNVEVFGEESWQ